MTRAPWPRTRLSAPRPLDQKPKAAGRRAAALAAVVFPARVRGGTQDYCVPANVPANVPPVIKQNQYVISILTRRYTICDPLTCARDHTRARPRCVPSCHSLSKYMFIKGKRRYKQAVHGRYMIGRTVPPAGRLTPKPLKPVVYGGFS
jgi:hypothetical protein